MRVLPHQALLDVCRGVDEPGLEDRVVGGRRARERRFSVSSKAADPAAPSALYVATARVTEVKKRLNSERSGARTIGFT